MENSLFYNHSIENIDNPDLARKQEKAMRRLNEYFRHNNYTIQQLNGSRTVEIKTINSYPEPQKGSEIYVSNIPQFVYEDTLLPVFSKVGTVLRMRLMMAFSGLSKGYGFVQYINPDKAADAIKLLNRYEIIPGKYLSVKRSVDNCRLFVGNIPKEISTDEVKIELKEILRDFPITNIFVFAGSKNGEKNRGYGFIEFKTHREAAISRRNLAKGFRLRDNDLNVDWAFAEKDVDDDILPQVTDLFVRCIPAKISENDLKIFVKHILPLKANFRIKMIRDFAFIQFDCHNIAKLALNLLKDATVKGHKLFVTWANPENDKKSEDPLNIIAKYRPKTSGRTEEPPLSKKLNGKNNGNNSNPVDVSYQPSGSLSFQDSPRNVVGQVVVNTVPPYMVQQVPNVFPQGANAYGGVLGNQIWAPVFQTEPDTSVTMYTVARYYLEICNFKYYDALCYLASYSSWGSISCNLVPKLENGTTKYEAKICVTGGPIKSLVELADPFVAIQDDDARQGAAFNVWKLLFPNMQLPNVNQYNQLPIIY